MMHGHPYATVLLGLTQMTEDRDMMEALAIESIEKPQVDKLIRALESVCDVSYRD
jgi:hypothetical protein